ncbi:TRAP transporter small permease [Sinorhizobium medicae]|uniref:TRAP transporter small permease n=1 Tax=Sinorhizobium medicae TaxID=110321 RepID=UPI0004191444|nr:TRAP transporter small permease [Sinorhizobium medicae]MBO1942011.1 TRAP transporter small permease [Sinorhizobium medicae]MDX0425585.1 TRAP transporter small permease subunit [Sinorhizobium medicae]MDX0432311.1 TRAP transporter small permease subunit [Sinorhizobium medicae]MDX0444314.1 TRAP transporter small permease subunit [Sinorhizobium medicae]MDX0462680.1 TRAP transporter small permease subunit [Sinorhizobium medicae]
MEISRSPEETIPLISLRRADEAVGVVALIVVVFSILWGVASRYVFPQPAAWTYELAMMAFAYLVFFGAVAGVRLGTHAAIDVLVAALPDGWQKAVAWFNYLLLALFFMVMTILFAWQAWTSRHVHTIALDLSRALSYAPLSLASAGMLFQHLIAERPWSVRLHRNPESLI